MSKSEVLGHWYGPWLDPPRPRLLAAFWERPRWLALPLAMMLVLTGLSVGATVQPTPPSLPGVAVDGVAQLYRGRLGTAEVTMSQQTLRRYGSAALITSPPESFFADPGGGRQYGDVSWVRESAVSTGPAVTQWHRLLGEDADGLHLAVETLGSRWRALQPMPLLLPNDDRTSWDATGIALTGPSGSIMPDKRQPFTWNVQTEADQRTGCRRYLITLTIAAVAEQRSEVRCSDSGLAELSGAWLGTNLDLATAQGYPTTMPAPRTSSEPPAWGGTLGWSGQVVALQRGGVAFGVPTNRNPQLTAGGALLLASNPSADAVLVDLRSATYRYATHHDSSIQVMNTFGDVTLLAGTARTIRAIDDQGRVLWTTQESDVTSVDFARLDDSHVVGVALDGSVTARDLLTGQAIWKSDVAGDVRTPPVVCGTSVAVAASGPAIDVFSAADGTRLRTIDVPGPIDTIDCAGPDVIVGDNQGDVRRFDLATGRRRWLANVIETIGSTVVTGGRVWIFSRSGSRPCDLETGDCGEIIPGAVFGAVSDGTSVFVLTVGGARMIGPDEAMRDVPGPALVGQSALMVADTDEVWTVNGDGAVIRWGPP